MVQRTSIIPPAPQRRPSSHHHLKRISTAPSRARPRDFCSYERTPLINCLVTSLPSYTLPPSTSTSLRLPAPPYHIFKTPSRTSLTYNCPPSRWTGIVVPDPAGSTLHHHERQPSIPKTLSEATFGEFIVKTEEQLASLCCCPKLGFLWFWFLRLFGKCPSATPPPVVVGQIKAVADPYPCPLDPIIPHDFPPAVRYFSA